MRKEILGVRLSTVILLILLLLLAAFISSHYIFKQYLVRRKSKEESQEPNLSIESCGDIEVGDEVHVKGKIVNKFKFRSRASNFYHSKSYKIDVRGPDGCPYRMRSSKHECVIRGKTPTTGKEECHTENYVKVLSNNTVSFNGTVTQINPYYDYVKVTPPTLQEEEEACEGVCAEFRSAVKNNNQEACKGLPNDSYLYSTSKCILKVAGRTENFSLCESIDLRADCIKSVAVSTDNSTLCHSIKKEDKLYECLERVGVKINDKEVCKEIPEGEWRRAICLKDINKKRGMSVENP